MFEVTVFERLLNLSKTWVDMVHGCIAYLGQKDKVSCLSTYPRWESSFAQTLPVVGRDNFWGRLKIAGVVGNDVGLVAIELLDIDCTTRPSIQGCIALWDKVRRPAFEGASRTDVHPRFDLGQGGSSEADTYAAAAVAADAVAE